MTAPVQRSTTPAAIVRTRAIVGPALHAAVDSLGDERMRLVAGYQLGLWDTAGTAYPGGGGKAVRPALVVLAAQAVGGTAETGYRAPSPSSWCTTSRCCTTTSWIATSSGGTVPPAGSPSARGRRSSPGTR